jgi:REP element-mobilizing transposase RayT
MLKFHNRHSIRLKLFDYSQPRYYFITICVQNRSNLFGNIINNNIEINNAGKMVQTWWLKFPSKFSNIILDEFIVMPNHIHGIIQLINNDSLVGADPRVCPKYTPRVCPKIDNGQIRDGQIRGFAPTGTIPQIVQWYKTMTTNEYIRNVKQNDWTPFPGRLWQRNYYEHIIRNHLALNNIRKYIINNPMNWKNDKNNKYEKK